MHTHCGMGGMGLSYLEPRDEAAHAAAWAWNAAAQQPQTLQQQRIMYCAPSDRMDCDAPPEMPPTNPPMPPHAPHETPSAVPTPPLSEMTENDVRSFEASEMQFGFVGQPAKRGAEELGDESTKRLRRWGNYDRPRAATGEPAWAPM